VRNVAERKREVMKGAHNSTYTTHPRSTKMYHDIKTHFWWIGMKRDVVDFVARCSTCQRVRTEHQKPGGLLQPLPIPVWKWEYVTIDFIIGLSKTTKHDDGIWVVVNKLDKVAHFLAIRITFTLEQLANLYI